MVWDQIPVYGLAFLFVCFNYFERLLKDKIITMCASLSSLKKRHNDHITNKGLVGSKIRCVHFSKLVFDVTIP